MNGLVNAGTKSERTKKILDEERRAVYTHQCGRTPNLDAYDMVQSKIIKDGVDTTFEISNLVEFSPDTW